MLIDLLVKYQRDGEFYSGSIYSYGELQEEFGNYTFAEKIRLVHQALQALPEVRLVFQRTDREGLLPVELDAAMVSLIRSDPAKYIEAHTVPHRVVDLRKGTDRVSKLAEKYEVPKHGAIRAGHDTLAAAFGDVVYLSMRKRRVEHPVTGRWVGVTVLEHELQLPISEIVTLGDELDCGWLVVRTEDLLKLQAVGYYLPRDWNEKGPWISRETLQMKFDQYKKDKQSCLEATAAT